MSAPASLHCDYNLSCGDARSLDVCMPDELDHFDGSFWITACAQDLASPPKAFVCHRLRGGGVASLEEWLGAEFGLIEASQRGM